MSGLNIQLLDTTPNWLGLTFVSSACTMVVVGVGVIIDQLVQASITPFSLVLHFALAVSVSAWILNLRFKMSPERKSLLAIGIVVSTGSFRSSLQQWLSFLQTGLINDFTFVFGAMTMDTAGGCVTYILFHLNVLRNPVS